MVLFMVRRAAARLCLVGCCGTFMAWHACASSLDSVDEARANAPQLSYYTDELERPWGMEFLPDGRLLITERPGGENLGGRMAMSDDGYLYLTVGDRYAAKDRMRAQSPAYYEGKTVRVRTDGSTPADNPFAQTPGARPEIWSLGHRNPGGAFVHPRTRQLWVSEHGPQGGDEINIVRKGANYGWPVITYGCEYVTCEQIGSGTHMAGMEQPFTFWGRPGIAPSNLIVYSGGQFPQWEGNVFVGALADRSVWRIELGGDDEVPQVKRRQQMFTELNERIRDIRQGPDGGLYLLTDGERGRVVRVARPDSAH